VYNPLSLYMTSSRSRSLPVIGSSDHAYHIHMPHEQFVMLLLICCELLTLSFTIAQCSAVTIDYSIHCALHMLIKNKITSCLVLVQCLTNVNYSDRIIKNTETNVHCTSDIRMRKFPVKLTLTYEPLSSRCLSH